MTPFTDEEFKRLKFLANVADDKAATKLAKGTLARLLSRLECAEEIVKHPCAKECGSCYCKTNREAWRKASGKTGPEDHSAGRE